MDKIENFMNIYRFDRIFYHADKRLEKKPWEEREGIAFQKGALWKTKAGFLKGFPHYQQTYQQIAEDDKIKIFNRRGFSLHVYPLFRATKGRRPKIGKTT